MPYFHLSSSYQESDSKVTADGVVGLTRAFLAAGAQCVLVSLWPVPVAASKMFVHAFYTALLNGTKASAALADAMKTLQGSKQFSHPSNWAGQAMILNTQCHCDDPFYSWFYS